MRKKSKLNQLIETSSKLIFQKGYEATTMRDIAAEMGYEVTNIYNYISSKNELLETILFEVHDQITDGLKDITGSQFGPIDKIKQIISLICQISYKSPYAMSIVLNEWRSLNDDTREQYLKSREINLSLIDKVIEQGIAENLIKKRTPRLFTGVLLSQCYWLFLIYLRKEEDIINPIELERQMCDIIIGGFSKD